MSRRNNRTVAVADLLDASPALDDLIDDDDAAADQFAMAMEGLVTAEPSIEDNPHRIAAKSRIEEIAAAAEARAAATPIHDRLGKAPTADKVIKSKASAPVAAAPKAPKAPKEMPLCQCGCGERTGGGKFLPGHDAKLKSRLFTEARGEDEVARVAALMALEQRGWLHLMGDKTAKPKTAPKATADPMEVIANSLATLGLSNDDSDGILSRIRRCIAEAAEEAANVAPTDADDDESDDASDSE